MMRALTVGFILLFFMRKEGFVTRYSSIVGLYSAEIKLRHTLFIYRRSVLGRNQASSRVIHLLSVCTRQKSSFVTRYSSIVGLYSTEIKLRHALSIYCRSVLDRNQTSLHVIHLSSVRTRQK